ncbi:MgtC/SapB family protein [Pontibaca salina]|uniref:Protein MgtC n=1 Tax=Pontibaca salina TaxID=2795731 RepID=A0A934HRN5_9RHOB|nr:MgtC/SapB family protein [Pontibaca salina]MBI6629420.1 MgtC/SapB family protein [Pontibaca salina]
MTWDDFVNEIAQPAFLPWELLLLRLAGAVLLCGAIGFERESRDRAAGLRTHMLIGLAAALYSLLMLELVSRHDEFPDMVRSDPLRIIEAVTGGVAFLAAGMIVFSQGKVRGLTTGASMWLAAAIGVSTGIGLWWVALMATALALIIIRLMMVAEKKAFSDDQDDN